MSDEYANAIDIGVLKKEKGGVIKLKKWGNGQAGDKNAKWRKRRGGAYCSPINKKFKAGIISKRSTRA